MSKTASIARASAKGSFHYLWGLVLSNLISSAGTIFIARLLGAEQYGLYAVVLSVPLLIMLLRDLGITSAIVQFTAQFRVEGRMDEIRSVYLSGIIFEIIMGLVLSVLSFVSADFLATYLFNRPAIAPLIRIASFVILTNGIIASSTAAFTGDEKMELNSIMIVCRSSFRVGFTVLLIILGFGTSGATIGWIVGSFIAAVIGLFFVWKIYRRLPKPTSHKLEIKAYLSTMLTYSIPLSFATIVTGLLPQYYAFLLPIHYVTNNVIVGNYNVAMNFLVLITFFSIPITSMTLPAFSKLDAQKDKHDLRHVFQFSVKYASLFVIPVTILVMSLSHQAIQTLFGMTYTSAPIFLPLLAIQFLYSAVGALSLTSLLSGQGRTRFVMKMALLTGIIGFPLGYFAIMNFGVLGLISVVLTANIPSMLLGLYFIKKTFDITIDWFSSIKILVSSAIAGLLTYIATLFSGFSSWVELVVGTIIFVLVFIPSILLTKSINRHDITNLKDMTKGLGIVGSLLKRVLDVLEKLMVFFNL